MTDLRQAAQQALEAVREGLYTGKKELFEIALHKLSAALEQPEQEPTCPECKAAVLYECVACSRNNYPPKPQQEPVAWRYRITNPAMDWVAAWSFQDSKMRPAVPTDHKWDVQPLYTTPPAAQRKWVGLTDDEAKEIYSCIHGYDSDKRIARAIEAKLKERNT